VPESDGCNPSCRGNHLGRVIPLTSPAGHLSPCCLPRRPLPVAAISSIRQPCCEAQRAHVDVNDERSKQPGRGACRLCSSYGYPSAVRSLPVPADLICVCSVARTLVRSGMFLPDRCLDQPWYNSRVGSLLRVRVVLLLIYCHCCCLSSLFCTCVPLYAYLLHGGAYFLNYFQLK